MPQGKQASLGRGTVQHCFATSSVQLGLNVGLKDCGGLYLRVAQLEAFEGLQQLHPSLDCHWYPMRMCSIIRPCLQAWRHEP